MNIVENKCALCQEISNLRNSHIMPAFVFKWIKNTSATGYLRNCANPNIRYQDGSKVKLLCSKCEETLSVQEKKFSEIIFNPYINVELSDDFVCQSKISSFSYGEWLLKFIISLHWRHLVTNNLTENELTAKQWKIVEETKEIWRRFLLGETKYTGRTDTHMLLHQSLAAADGNFPPNLNKDVNFYLLRAVDSTIAASNSKLAIYNKIGPISFFTLLKPEKLKNAVSSRIHLKGVYQIVQDLTNTDLSDFVFITRPNDAMSVIKYSKTQNDKIKSTMLNNPEKTINSKTIRANTADIILRAKLNRT